MVSGHGAKHRESYLTLEDKGIDWESRDQMNFKFEKGDNW